MNISDSLYTNFHAPEHFLEMTGHHAGKQYSEATQTHTTQLNGVFTAKVFPHQSYNNSMLMSNVLENHQSKAPGTQVTDTLITVCYCISIDEKTWPSKNQYAAASQVPEKYNNDPEFTVNVIR